MSDNQKVNHLAFELDKEIKSLNEQNAANLRKVFYKFAAKKRGRCVTLLLCLTINKRGLSMSLCVCEIPDS